MNQSGTPNSSFSRSSISSIEDEEFDETFVNPNDLNAWFTIDEVDMPQSPANDALNNKPNNKGKIPPLTNLCLANLIPGLNFGENILRHQDLLERVQI